MLYPREKRATKKKSSVGGGENRKHVTTFQSRVTTTDDLDD
jgi:hypothetical protein